MNIKVSPNGTENSGSPKFDDGSSSNLRNSDLISSDSGDSVGAWHCPPRRRGHSLSFSIALLGLALSIFLLVDLRGDFLYWFSNHKPVDLGNSQKYHFDRLANDAYAVIQGSPSSVAQRYKRLGQNFEIVAIQDTPVLVRRPPKWGEMPMHNGKPAPPDAAAFIARGRLVQDQSIPEYAPAFEYFLEKRMIVPQDNNLYVLLEGEIPRSGWKTPAIAAGLLFLLVWNARALLKASRVRAKIQ